MNTTESELTLEQRTRALELYRAYIAQLYGTRSNITGPDFLSEASARAWLAVEEYILANHTCAPTWRPTTFEEIQAGWEVRARLRDGVGATWGVAHRQDGQGDWYTEAGRLLTFVAADWAYETTAPAPEPEPWPAGAVDCLEDALIQRDVKDARPSDARALLDALAARYPGIRDAIKEGD